MSWGACRECLGDALACVSDSVGMGGRPLGAVGCRGDGFGESRIVLGVIWEVSWRPRAGGDAE